MDDATQLPSRGIKPLISLSSHPWLALVVALLIVVVGVPFAWIKGKPTYSTEAVIQVAPRYMRNLREDQELDFQSNTQYRQFVQHQARSLGRYDILSDALKSLGPKRYLWQLPAESDRRAIERLRAQLKVSAVPDTYMLSIKLEGPKKEGLSEVVNAVVNTFIARMKSEEIYGSDERTRNLQDREKALLLIIADKVAARGKIARELSLTTFHEGTPNPYDKLVSDLRAKLSDAHQRRSDANAAVAAFNRHGDTNIFIRSIQDAVQTDPGLNSLKAALSKRRADLLTQISGLRSDHPGRLAANKELAEIDQDLAKQSTRLESDVRRNIQSRLQGTADQAKQVELDLAEELATLEKQATSYATLFQQAMTLTDDIGQARTEMDRVRERINYLNIESTSKGFNRLITVALPPEMPFGPGRTKLLLMVLLSAIVGGLCAPTVRDLLDRRVFTVDDVHRVTGIPPAGWQIELNGAATELFAKEQLRRMASALIRAKDASGNNVFGLTALKPGAGATSLTIDIASTLRALGHKVLVVEANGFTRDRRYRSDKPGLLELLHGQAASHAVIVGATADLPPRVAVGGKGRVQLDRLDRLKDVLSHWAGIADFVLVDMPPLTACADAELLVKVLGQTLLVVDAGHATRAEVKRATRQLRQIDPDAVGILVNRVVALPGSELQELMLESVSGRRSDAVLTLPIWKLWFDSLRLRTARNFHPFSRSLKP